MKCVLFDTKSATVITVSQLEDLESSMIKSILNVSYHIPETGRGYNSPTKECLIDLVYNHRLQVLTY